MSTNNDNTPTNVGFRAAAIHRAVERFSPYWQDLPPVERLLAERVTRDVELVGGRGEAAKIMEVGVSTIDNYRSGKRQPKALDLLRLQLAQQQAIGAKLEANIEKNLAAILDTPDGTKPEKGERKNLVGSFDPDADDNDEGYSHETWKPRIPGARPEIDVRLGAGEGSVGQMLSIGSNGGTSGHRVVAEWVLPEAFLVGVMEANAGRTIVMEVVGDSMQTTYQPGDRVIVDLAQTKLVADTVYAISDGFSEPQIKRLQRVPFSQPARVRIISDNPSLQTDEVDLERVHIIGRICGVMARR